MSGGSHIMLATLRAHPGFPGAAVSSVTVDVALLEGMALRLRYRVHGAPSGLRLPARAVSSRADALWKHTCFEVFIPDGDGAGYCEFNFSPSTQWAVYRFDATRQGMRPAELSMPPQIGVQAAPDSFELDVVCNLAGLFSRPPGRIGLSAVIEEADGTLSYWALAHPAARPDFHHPDGFVLALPHRT